MKTFENFINEKLSAKKPNETETVEVDMSYDDKKEAAMAWKKFKLTVVEIEGGQGTEHEVTGKKKDILAYLQSEYYEMDDESIEEYYPELLEGNILDEAMVQIEGSKKPGGAQVLATVLVDYMIQKDFLKPGLDNKSMKNALIQDLQKFIMDNTF
jgi:hypothetical protein